MDKIFGLLTIAKRAGKLILGMDPVKEGIVSGKVTCVLVASDISHKSLKEMKFALRQTDISLLELSHTRNDVLNMLSKESVIIAICDEGFSNALKALCRPVEKTDKQ